VILITTSRHPSARTRSLCNDLARMIPDSMRINRGKLSNDGLLALASEKGARTLVVIDSHMGNPSVISFTSVQRDHRSGASLKLFIVRVRLQRELLSETKIYRSKKLMVLKGVGGVGLERLTKMLASFLGGNLIETTDEGKLQGEFGERRVTLTAEERSGEIILKFLDTKSLGEHGPQITVKKEHVLPIDIGGLSVD
jgi:rRNA maturation protein Rpf1